jgi:hypothetical protein
MPSLDVRIARLERVASPDASCTCPRLGPDQVRGGVAKTGAELDALNAALDGCPVRHSDEALVIALQTYIDPITREFTFPPEDAAAS